MGLTFSFKCIFPVSSKLTHLRIWRITYFFLIGTVASSEPFIRAMNFRIHECTCTPLRVSHKIQIISDTTFIHLCEAVKAVTASQLSLQFKVTFDESQERLFFSCRCELPFRTTLEGCAAPVTLWSLVFLPQEIALPQENPQEGERLLRYPCR